MTTREYLKQIRSIDLQIDIKLGLLSRLRALATKASTVLSDMPRGDSPNLQPMETIVVNMIDLENEINSDIDRLIDLKREILQIIQNVRDPRYQSLLEMRYLGYMKWEDIAEQLECDVRSAYRAHEGALRAVNSILRKRSDPI